MNPAEYMQFGNILRGQYTAQQQAILNQQRQQQINDMLANDALKRHLMQQQVTGGGMGLMALGSTPTAQPPAPVASPVAPAPAPGQNSAQRASPVAVPSPVPMPGAIQQQPLPPMGAPAPSTPWQIAPQVQARRDRGAIDLMQQELQRQQTALSTATPAQAQQIQGNIAALRQQIASMSQGAAPPSAPATAPVPPTQTLRGVSAAEQGVVGKSLALAQNNLPISLVAKFVQNFKRMYPDATPEQAYYAMQQASPVLTAQAADASRLAGMGIDSLFKGLTSWAQITNARTRQAEVPSMIARNTAMANLYGSIGPAQGGGTSGPQSGTPAPSSNAMSYMETGQRPPMGRYQEYGFQNQVNQQAKEFGVPVGALPSVWATYKSSQGAQNNLQKNYSQFQTSANTLHATYQRAAQLAKQLELDGIAKVNQGRLFVDRSVAPTGSPQAQLVAQYDALLNEMKRDYGVVSAFGKMTGYGFKSASDVFDPNRGVALDGVNAAIQFGTTQGENAFQTTLTNLQNAAQIKLIDLSKNKESAANAVGFQLGAPGLVQQYAKKYNMTPQEARSQLLAQRIYVGN